MLVTAVITLTAYFKMRGAGTNVDVRKPATTVVTDGIYSYTRNPMYVSMVVFLVAMSVLLNNLWIMILIPVFIFILRKGVIRGKSSTSKKSSAHEYREYKNRVRRWL